MAAHLNYANTLSPKTARSVLVPPDATDVPAAVMEAKLAGRGEGRGAQARRPGCEGRQAPETEAPLPRRGRPRRRPPGRQEAAGSQRSRMRGRRSTLRNGPATSSPRSRPGDLPPHGVTATHQRGWLDAQQPVTDNAVADLAELIDQLDHGFARAAAGAGIEPGLRRFDPRSESPKLRTLAPSRRDAGLQARRRRRPS